MPASSMELLKVTLILLCCISFGLGKTNPDAITFLPGLTKQPSFSQFSGYLTGTGGKMLHYWFVTSQSKPASDPLVLWTNGGPGCSSMLGILTENGPFTIQPDGVTLAYNDNSWNKFANVLYLESPAGVGFSYSPDGNVTTSDDLITEDHYTALLDFYKKYPTYTKNQLFLIGESYSGVYTPLLAKKVIDAIDKGTFVAPFTGFAVGNGVTNYEYLANSLIYLLFYHGIIGRRLWDALQKDCCTGPSDCNFYNTTSANCTADVSHAHSLLAGLNPYNILADCAGGAPHQKVMNKDRSFRYIPEFDLMYRGTPIGKLMRQKFQSMPINKLGVTPPCLNYTSLSTYLNNEYTKTALHIKTGLPSWEPCSAAVSMKYVQIYKDLSQVYRDILSNLQHQVRILVYNGDLDTACNFLGNQWFVDALGAEDEVQWRPWIFSDGSDQIAGFVKEYHNIAFVTVKGAGHMAPEDKPVATSLLISNFLSNKPY